MHKHLHLTSHSVFSPGVILVGILPLLIFASGRKIRPAALTGDALEISYLALPGVVLTAVLFGWNISWILDIPLLPGLVLGVAIAASDLAAVVVSIFPACRYAGKVESDSGE